MAPILPPLLLMLAILLRLLPPRAVLRGRQDAWLAPGCGMLLHHGSGPPAKRLLTWTADMDCRRMPVFLLRCSPLSGQLPACRPRRPQCCNTLQSLPLLLAAMF
jgi:hypothetical protein